MNYPMVPLWSLNISTEQKSVEIGFLSGFSIP